MSPNRATGTHAALNLSQWKPTARLAGAFSHQDPAVNAPVLKLVLVTWAETRSSSREVRIRVPFSL